jgi:hypothetical protein
VVFSAAVAALASCADCIPSEAKALFKVD